MIGQDFCDPLSRLTFEGQDRAGRNGAVVRGVYLPGGSQVDIREVADPRPGHGQVVLSMRASTICGSDLRAIYREHLGSGPEAYQAVIGGHEPAGLVEEIGPGVNRIRPGDRVVVYHISGCGQCDECRRGYQISCNSPARAAYGWQRDGGHADKLLVEERDLLVLPGSLEFLDGACVACGFGTAYEALCRTQVSGRDRVLVTGLGPVGLAVGMLARAMGAISICGTDPSQERRDLALQLGAVDVALEGRDDEVKDTVGDGVEVAIECSGNGAGQLTALRNTRRWGRVALVGEGGRLTVDVSEVLIHKQLTVHGSWVSSTWRMSELLDRLVAWNLHPGTLVTDTFDLDQAALAFSVADAANSGKVGFTWQ
jgi:threonine dehydrogenase-like Zn-dependent dehydrogenase